MAFDTISHKKLVLDNCYLFFKYLIKNGETQLGIDLLKRGATHDNSKFDSREFKSLAKILKNKKCFTNPKQQLSSEEIAAIKYHWSHNRHHPEYFNDKIEMTKLDILEMVCDWYARSLQYNTDFIPFILERQKNRFKFEANQFNEILNYCNLIKELHDNEKECNS
jgi:hypothetical protein